MGLGRNLKRLARRAGNLVLPAFHHEQPPDPHPEEARAVIVSFFMKNIDPAVVSAQRKVLERFVPSDIRIAQIRTRLLHGEAINRFLRTTRYPTYFLLDIDCIPLRRGAIEKLVAQAEAGRIAGAVQRSSHRDNDAHLYAGPFCVAFARATFEALGRPNFLKTKRGDVGEELTYIAADRDVPVDFLWPSHVEVPLYPLVDDLMFGYGTTYEGLFWHAGESRAPSQQKSFVARCNEVLAEADDST